MKYTPPLKELFTGNIFHVICFLLFAPALLNAQFVFNGSATSLGGGCYQLTPDQPSQAGSFFSAAPINLTQPFSISTRFNFGCKDPNGADGIVFIFATTNTALGGGGGGLGYQGITPSLAVEYDDYQNGNFGDPAADHVAIMQNGSVDHASANNLAGPITLPNIEDCNDHCFSLTWNPSSQTLTSVLDGNPISYTGNIVANIFGGNPNVYYGFSSGTGSLSNAHKVCIGPPQVVPMPDVSICPGTSTQLQADPNGMSWFWAPHPTLSGVTISNPTATPLNTTIYAVTITYACGQTATDNVQVSLLPQPTATASSNSPVCAGQTLQLNASGGMSYSWSGPQGFAASQQNPSIPNVGLANAGTYTVTVTGANGCTATASTTVIVFPPPLVAIVPPPLPLCVNAPPQTIQAAPPGGVWGGAANAQGQVNPAQLGPGTHIVTYTYTDQNGCSATVQTSVQVVPLPVVAIAPAGPFCQTAPVQTLVGTPSGGFWGGVANAQGQINPGALGPGNHMATYQYIDGNACSATATATIQITASPVVSITPAGPFCQNDSPFTMTGSPAGGVWSGAANAQGQVNPASLGPGMHTITYEYTTPGGCTGLALTTIQVHCQPSAVISGGGVICEGSGQNAALTLAFGGIGGPGPFCFVSPYSVTYAINGVPQPPVTVSTNPFTLPANIPGTYTVPTIVGSNGCTNTGTGSALVEVVDAPDVSSFQAVCDSTATTYTVSFVISNGDPATYTVTGPIPGQLSPMAPYTFVSNPIPAGSPYSFVVNDGNNCDPTTLSGSFSCQCITDAGTMNLAPISVCAGDTVTAIHNGNETLDPNDNLVFVLHSSNGNSLGTIFGTNSVAVFYLVPPMMPGVTYYISAVAGDDNGAGGVNLSDPCLSTSFGTPVVFRALPTGSIGSNAEICAGEQAMLVFNLTGNAPFKVTYSNGSQTLNLNNIFNGHSINVSPAQTTTYTLLSVSDNSSPACSTAGGNSATVTVWPHKTTPQPLQICYGDSVFLQGAFQKTAGIYKDTLSTIHGCDSSIVSTLTVHPVDTTYLSDTSCNPNSAGTTSQLLSNGFGCDSLVITTISFSQTDTMLLTATTCDPMLAGVFTNIYTTPEGCDSTVIQTVSLLPTDTTNLFNNTCNPNNVGTFNQNLTNQWGCDSTVVTTVSYSLSDTTLLSSASCDPAMTGVFTNTFINSEGCDSVVIETVSLLPSDTTYLSSGVCDPAGTGVFTNIFTNQYGCDSTVIEIVSLLPSDTTYTASSICDPAGTGVFTTVLTNQYGCDSTVIETVSLLPSDTTYLTQQSCNPLDTGTMAIIFTNQFGCDSTVVTVTSLLPPSACGIEASLTGSTIPCDAASGTISLTVGLGEAPFSYVWTGPSSGSGTITSAGMAEVISGLPAGNYSVTVTAANGLTTTVQAVINKLNPPVLTAFVTSDYSGFGVSCNGAADGSITANASGAVPFSFLWSNGAATKQAANLPAGFYTVTVTDANGCTVTGPVSLTQPPLLEITFTVNDLDCFGQTDGAIFVETTGGTLPYRYSLDDGLFQNSNAFLNLAAGTFELTAQDANGCEATEFIGINAPIPLDVELGENQLILLGENATLNAIVNLPFDSLATIIWTGLDTVECPNCLTQTVSPLFTTTYAIAITAANGCKDKDNVTIAVDRRRHVYIPNAFSPNNDGTNDGFMIFAKENTVANIKSFLVFNRWGETVWQYFNFQPNDPAFGWDGKHRNQPMDPAVFTWFAEIEFIDGKTELFKGDVTLVR